MSARKKILDRMTRSKNQAVERVIGIALLNASEEHRGSKSEQELADVLFERESRAGRVALVKAFNRLGPDSQDRLLSDTRELFGALSEAMQEVEGPARENVIEIVRQSGNPRLVYLLAEALLDVRPEVRELAGISLLTAVRKFRTREESCVMEGAEEAADAAQMHKAVDHALKQFRSHKQGPALLAALIFEREQDSRMWSFFCDPHDELTKTAGAILRSPPTGVGAAVAPAMFIALGTSLKPAAMAGISGTEDPDIASALMSESYRLLDPVLRQVSQQIGHARLLATMWKQAPADDVTWSHWLRLIDGLGLQVVERIMWLGRLLTRGSEGMEASGGRVAWKLSVMRSLAETQMPEAGRTLVKMMEDPDERVARVAARYVLSKKNAEWRAMAGSVRSPHPSVRRMFGYTHGERSTSLSAVVASAAAVNDNADQAEPRFGQVWGEYPKMPPAVQGTTARASSEADPQFAEQLKAKLAHTQAAEVGQGLKMLGTLTDVKPYRAQIISLCGHADARIAAMAVKLVGRLEDPKLKVLLEAAAQHADPRVRANSVESMTALHVAQSSQHVLALLNSRHNRERANAIKAISEFDFVTARECLSRMLSDPNPLHRISALWVVEQLGLPALFRQVATIGRRDRNVRVKSRADEIITSVTGGNVPGETR